MHGNGRTAAVASATPAEPRGVHGVRHRPFSRDNLSYLPVQPLSRRTYCTSRANHRIHIVTMSPSLPCMSHRLTAYTVRANTRQMPPTLSRPSSPMKSKSCARNTRRKANTLGFRQSSTTHGYCQNAYLNPACAPPANTSSGPNQIERPSRPARRCAPPV